MRFKRYKRYGRKRSTNVIRMKFQSFMDISTSDQSMQIITISAGGREILKRLAPQFGAYKYYKIGAISAKLVPASTLPVDPTGLSYEAGENTVDPRDQLTPGMMRITNGEDIFENISGLTDAQQHAIYNNMLLDPRWFKWMLQSGTSRRAYPRYWQIGQLHQDKWPGAVTNVPLVTTTTNPDVISGTATFSKFRNAGDGDYDVSVGNASSPLGLFQTGHKGVLGWLPTDGLYHLDRPSAQGGDIDQPFLASPPEVEVMKIILPKAYKTRYFYRLFITEEVLFREPIVNFGITASDSLEYRPLDVFHYIQTNGVALPGSGQSSNRPTDQESGGNYGDS